MICVIAMEKIMQIQEIHFYKTLIHKDKGLNG